MISTRALLLRATPYRDSDLVVDLLTAAHGRLAALARGARKSRRRFGGVLDYFNLLHVEVGRGRGALGSLGSVELLGSWEVLRTDVDAYCTGSHLLDLARLGTREGDAAPELFRLLLGGLDALQRGAHPASLARVFQVQALARLGYAPVARHCPGCGVALGTAAAGRGVVICRGCAEPTAAVLSAGAVRTLQAAAELPPERLGALRLPPALAAEVVPFLDAALELALGRRPNSVASLPGFGRIDPPPRGLVP
ncbi:MAG TPA: DNA repair protein RecO [Deferrisomatales bacterium]|nr:DNA repair protein RecO [Deferrisomatales bacterium]